MPFSEIWRRVGIIRTDVSEERVASIFRVEENRERIKVLAIFSNYGGVCHQTVNNFRSRILPTLKMGATLSSETFILTAPTRCHIPEDGIVQKQLAFH
jgi:hypothetical protein